MILRRLHCVPAAGARVSMGGPPPKGRLTCSALLCAMVAALGGLIFGYDIGGGGGAQVMLGFNWQFGPLATPPTPPSSRLGALTTLCSRSNAWRPIAGFLKPPQLYPPGTPVSEMDTDMNDPLNIFIGEAQYIDAVRPPIICPTTLDWLTHTCASVVGWQDRLVVYLWCGRGRDPIGLPCGHLRTQTLHHHLRPRLLHRSFDPGVRGRGAQDRG